MCKKRKSKEVKIKYILLITIIAYIVTSILSLKSVFATENEQYGVINLGDSKIIFSEYRPFMSRGIPYKLYANEGISFWCMEHGAGVGKYMTGSIEHFKVFPGTSNGGPSQYYNQNPSKYYRHSETEGLIPDHHSWYDPWSSGILHMPSRLGSSLW